MKKDCLRSLSGGIMSRFWRVKPSPQGAVLSEQTAQLPDLYMFRRQATFAVFFVFEGYSILSTSI